MMVIHRKRTYDSREKREWEAMRNTGVLFKSLAEAVQEHLELPIDEGKVTEIAAKEAQSFMPPPQRAGRSCRD